MLRAVTLVSCPCYQKPGYATDHRIALKFSNYDIDTSLVVFGNKYGLLKFVFC